MSDAKGMVVRLLGNSVNVPKLIAVGLLCCGTLLTAEEAQRVPDRLLVKAKHGVSERTVHALLTVHGASQQSLIKQIEVRVVHVPPPRLDAVLKGLRHDPRIEFAEPDHLLSPALSPNDAYYSLEWHLPKIEAPAAWDTTFGSNSVIIAILDSGVDSTHPDLAGQLVPGWNFYDNNSDTSDVTGHGTGVAGNAAGKGNNTVGIASIAWGCKIMPIRVADPNGYASTSMIAEGVTYAADHGARVANASFHIAGSATLSNAAQYFQSKGGVITVSAGNDGAFDPSPDDPYLITVSATDSNDAVASFSNTGNNVDLSAPGVNIVTTIRGGGYGYATGTSASAPLVAGVAGLILSVNPGLTATQVQDILKQSADDLGAPGWDPSYGWGRVNVRKAVLAALATQGVGTNGPPDVTAPTATITAPASGSIVSGVLNINVTATDDVGVTRVEWYLNGACAGTNSGAPAMFSWDTTGSTNGSYVLGARAYDAAGNMGSAASVTVTVQNVVPDVTAPAVALTAPAAASTVSGIVSVNVSATDNIGVTRIEWYLNGNGAGTNFNASAAFSWDTTATTNGSNTLQARAYDAAGNVGASSTITVSVQNALPDVTPPTVRITSPSNGTALTGKSVTVFVTASDNVGVTRVDLLVDGKNYATSSSATPVFSWNISKLSRGSHTLQAVAYDAAGNSTRSAVVTVTK